MLWWMNSYTRYDRIGNTIIKRKLGLSPAVEKMIDTCLIKQFRYDWRRRVEPPARRIYQMDDSQIDRSRGRP